MAEALEISIARLEQQVQDLSTRVERGFLEIKDSTVTKIHALECNKADKDEVEKVRKVLEENHEARIRKVENGLVYVFAFATACGTIISLALEYFLKK
jgi:LPS O-antigen subunit length determinant protein (WzzB/FepE family)